MQRRSFLVRVSGVLVSVAAVGPLVACGADVGQDVAPDLGPPVLLAALGATEVRVLGMHYIRLTPEETEIMALTRAMAVDVRDVRGLPWNTAPSYAELVADDFAHDRTVWVDGWLLSRNEARRMALFALLTPS
ncbi:MAG: hypothetical protein IT353_01685 [Gemmatimonadaceae bacterium]|nr:hypothetical protein [Gemmatimonadaceae bacterium]